MATNQSKQIAPIDEIQKSLDNMAPQFKMALPAHIKVDKFMRVVRTAIQMNKELLDCDRRSLYSEAMKAAQDGLLPDGREAVLNTFRCNVGTKEKPRYEKHAVYMPMIGGILKKVRNSGQLKELGSYLVYEGEQFDYWIDDQGEHVMHKPSDEIDHDDKKILRVWARAQTKDGGIYIEVMSRAQVEKVRSVSKAKDSGPWKQWWGEMARKTVLRRLSKRLPMSTDLEAVILRDDALYDLEQPGPGAKDMGAAEVVPPAAAPSADTKPPKRLQNAVSKKGNDAPNGPLDPEPPPIEWEVTHKDGNDELI